MKKATPRWLVMSLFNAPETSTLTIGQLIMAGALFDIEAAAIRMAVTRLIKDQLISSTARGVYSVGDSAISLNSEAQNWRKASSTMADWNGDLFMVLSNHLGRTNKTQLRSMIRAFQLYGFKEIELGVWLRPANLDQGIDQLKNSLVDIGMDSRVHLMCVSTVAGIPKETWGLHWPIAQLEAGYLAMINTLETSLGTLKRLNYQDAAKESLIVGESAIRLINLDPLLPKEFIDTELFKKLVADMIIYEGVGQKHWQKLLSS